MRQLRFVALWLGLAAAAATAQFGYFGKNKVQTRDYNWQSYQTEHFTVLFYAGGEALAEFAAKAAEGYYARTARDLDVELEARVPLILYLSPSQFTETNVITDVIEEDVGGFSELFKNRIVIPFDGSYANLHHVIGHELAHIFEFQMFFRSRLSALLGAVGEFQVPLWVMEGFAEFQSGWVTVDSDVFMRDLVLNDRLLSLTALNDDHGYLAYREGESFFRFVEARYGRQKVYDFMQTLRSKRSLDATFNSVFGMSQERVGDEWSRWLKERYWPQVGGLAVADRLLHRLTDHERDGSVYNTAPALAPSGARLAMVSDRSEYVDCYVISALDGRVLTRLVKGGRSGGFENMHLLRPGVAWSPDETLVAVVATSSGLDNIALIEYPGGRVRRRVQGNLDGVYAPRFSPDGSRLAFVGLKNGYSDIYVAGVASGEPERLTYDIYEDLDPAFSPSGDTVVFVSDRPDAGEAWAPGRYAVWMRDAAGAVRRVSGRGSGVASPVFTGSGEYLLYVAADSGKNVHVYSLARQRVERRTRLLGEASHLSLSRDDRKLALAYFANGGWDVAVLHEPLESIPADTQPGPIAAGDTAGFEKAGLDFERVKPARFSLSIDYAAGAASYSGGGGGALSGVLDIAFSDMLGNHRFEVIADLYGDILNSDAAVLYALLPYRTDFGFALFQYREYPYYAPGSRLLERLNRGGQVLVSYPFDRFLRGEAGLNAYASEVTLWRYNHASQGGGWYVFQDWWERTFFGSGALVLDNTLWTAQGPSRGTRVRVEGGSSFLSDSSYQLVYGDLRNYQRLGRRYVFATRLLAAGSFGDAPGFYLGGEDVRGYNWSEFYDVEGPGLALLSCELRYPFIDRLKIAFPLPIDIRGIRGVAFLDGGLVLRDRMRLWGGGRLQDLKLGAGAGLRLQISLFTFKLDFAKPLSRTTDQSWKFVFSLGTDF